MYNLNSGCVSPRVIAFMVALSPCLTYAAPPQDQLGVLLKFGWNVGEVHPEQSRWQANFAMGYTGNVVRSVYDTASFDKSADSQPDYEHFASYYQKRSLMPLQWSTDSLGNSMGALYGFPVVSKLSPVSNANGAGTGGGSGTSIASNPWVWVGVGLVGLAAASGGGGGGGGSSSGSGGGTEVTVVGGQNGGDCAGTETGVGSGGVANTDDPSDPGGVDAGCGAI